jgi:hypothetical protein
MMAIYASMLHLIQEKPMENAASRIANALGEIWIRCKFDQRNLLCVGLYKDTQFFLFLSRQFVEFQFRIQNLKRLLKGLALL